MLVYKLKNSNTFCNKSITFLKLLNHKFFVFEKTKTYLLFPEYIFLKKAENTFFFVFPDMLENKALNFLNYFLNFFLKSTRISRKRLTLVGLGFRASITNLDTLTFKLGFSHVVNIKIPDYIKVVIIKNNIYLESSNSVALGLFASCIKNLKLPDNYKGKGFWFYSEKKKLKPVKKT